MLGHSLLFPTLFMECSLEETHCTQPTLEEWRVEGLCKSFEIFLHGKFMFLFIYLFSNGFMSVWTNEIHMGAHTHTYSSLCILLLKVFPFGHWKQFDLAPASFWHKNIKE